MAEPADTLITVEDMLAHGADAVSASCWRCGKLWRSPIMMLPPETTLARIRELMMRRDCGSETIHVGPAWPESAPEPQ